MGEADAKDVNAEFRRIVGRFGRLIRACPALSPRDKLVAGAMLDRLDRRAFSAIGELVTWEAIGVEELAEDTALCERDVVRARAVLTAQRIIELTERAAKGRPARYRFCLRWMGAELARAAAATEDTGVPDPGVLTSAVGRTPEAPTEDSSGVVGRTPESSTTCNPGIPSARAGMPAGAHAREGTVLPRLAEHFQPAEISSWLVPCRFVFDGGSVTLWAPTRFVRDWISRTEFLDRLKAALGVYDVEIRLGSPPAPSPFHHSASLHALPTGRA